MIWNGIKSLNAMKKNEVMSHSAWTMYQIGGIDQNMNHVFHYQRYLMLCYKHLLDSTKKPPFLNIFYRRVSESFFQWIFFQNLLLVFQTVSSSIHIRSRNEIQKELIMSQRLNWTLCFSKLQYLMGITKLHSWSIFCRKENILCT